MGKYIIRRLLQMIPVIIGVTFIIYALGLRPAGRPDRGPLRRAAVPAELRRRVQRADYNLDKPLLVQYAALHGQSAAG